MHKSNPLILLHPFLETDSLIDVGGREQISNQAYSTQYPFIVHGSHPITHLIICSEHL